MSGTRGSKKFRKVVELFDRPENIFQIFGEFIVVELFSPTNLLIVCGPGQAEVSCSVGLCFLRFCCPRSMIQGSDPRRAVTYVLDDLV